jgi:hypothetical protein
MICNVALGETVHNKYCFRGKGTLEHVYSKITLKVRNCSICIVKRDTSLCVCERIIINIEQSMVSEL